MPGLLWNGAAIDVPGLTILNPTDAPWCKLDPGDYCYRPKGMWLRQVIVHSTKGNHPSKVIPGKGPGGKGKIVADFWKGDPTHSAAQLVIDNDGTVACLCDLATTMAYHATVSNVWSVGIELYQESNNGIYEAVYEAAVLLIPALCNLMGIPFQGDTSPYANAPLQRMIHGGADCVGVFGHRSNTDTRGRGDPGDEIFTRLVKHGMHGFDFAAGGDRAFWLTAQRLMNHQFNEKLAEDGICGPLTLKAARLHNLW